MKFKLSKRSLERLKDVEPDLVKVVKRAIELSKVDFAVLEGRRSMDRQRQLVRLGKSKTLNSRHLTGHAVDLVPWVKNAPLWDMDMCREINEAMQAASKELDIPVEWGGNWSSFKDGPHFQIPWPKEKD